MLTARCGESLRYRCVSIGRISGHFGESGGVGDLGVILTYFVWGADIRIAYFLTHAPVQIRNLVTDNRRTTRRR